MESAERPNKMRKLSHDAITAQHIESNPQHNGDALVDIDNIKSESTQNTVGNLAKPQAEEDVDKTLPPPDEMAPVATSTTPDPREIPLSKNQQKKLRKKAEWEAKREDRKALRKTKNTERKERKRQIKRQALAEGKPLPAPKPYVRPSQLPVTFLIDCDFDDLMREGERISLASQITRCYSDNKNAKFRAHLTICSFTGKLRERFDTVLTANYKLWRGVREFREDFVQVAEKAKEWMSSSSDEGGKLGGVFAAKYANLSDEAQQKLKDEGEIVYLSSEADEDLTELKPYSTYIIGGLVDKNREKGICHRRATTAGVKTAKLPIGKYMDMQSRKVLATNHVHEIMIQWLECGDWGEAFLKVIPKRKGGRIKKMEEGREGVDDDDDDEGSPNADEPDPDAEEEEQEQDDDEGGSHAQKNAEPAAQLTS